MCSAGWRQDVDDRDRSCRGAAAADGAVNVDGRTETMSGVPGVVLAQVVEIDRCWIAVVESMGIGAGRGLWWGRRSHRTAAGTVGVSGSIDRGDQRGSPGRSGHAESGKRGTTAWFARAGDAVVFNETFARGQAGVGPVPPVRPRRRRTHDRVLSREQSSIGDLPPVPDSGSGSSSTTRATQPLRSRRGIEQPSMTVSWIRRVVASVTLRMQCRVGVLRTVMTPPSAQVIVTRSQRLAATRVSRCVSEVDNCAAGARRTTAVVVQPWLTRVGAQMPYASAMARRAWSAAWVAARRRRSGVSPVSRALRVSSASRWPGWADSAWPTAIPAWTPSPRR